MHIAVTGLKLTGFRDRSTSLGLLQLPSSPFAAYNWRACGPLAAFRGCIGTRQCSCIRLSTKPRNACHIPPLHCVPIAPVGRFTSYPSQWCSQPLPFLQRLVRLATLPCSGAGYSPARLGFFLAVGTFTCLCLERK
jgi:hypothetical protein